MAKHRPPGWNAEQAVAGNGLLHRRRFLEGGAAIAAAITGYALSDSVAAQQLADDPWSVTAGSLPTDYGVPSRFERSVARTLSNPKGEPRTSHARTPHHLLNGTITPNGLHFVISHSGNPDIDPDKHRLLIHGLVRRPLVFTLDALTRYPMVSRMAFIECGGNGAPLASKEPIDANVQAIHGLVSCAEWTGVMLSTLLEETGIDPKAKWFVAEGGDSLALSRSVPVSKALDDAMIALYQNGERLMPGNGYPMRLLLPGWEGNMNVKYLRRIELVDAPAMSFYESRTYAQILPGGKAFQFYFIQEVKSFITHPSPGLKLSGPGLYEISGIAYSGNGRIAKVMVSADGGRSWAQAALQEPINSKAFTRFRAPWRWDGGPAVLQSRAWDEAGNVQPTRAEIIARRGETKTVPNVLAFPAQHYNTLTSWGVERTGEVKHVYA
ncbi:MAG TPA: sulfite dehydrogenase [Vicinamibacterales bacterium]|jgi:sulfane dehydrogenase subunit SoxC|nr:sulfite dehydrogenase [Vicinamibacterales bacterium]